MKQISGYCIVLTAYNEEATLLDSFIAVKKSIDYSLERDNHLYGVNVVICPNGCTDKTAEIAEKIKEQFSDEKINIEVISSAKGMVVAQNACMKFIREKYEHDTPIVFIDTDSLIDEKAISIFIKQFELHETLKAVGAHPIPIPYTGKSFMRKFWDRVLNCRAYYPKSEVTVNYAPEYHPFADSDPQEIGADYEKHSKIYFHGRCFTLRNESVWDVPLDSIGEDTYMDRSIHFRYGPGSIRTMYDAKIYFYPMNRLKDFSATFYRIYSDLKKLKHTHPELNGVREYSKTKLDWAYIMTLPFRWIFFFCVYASVRKYYHFVFKNNLAYSKKSVFDVWSYEHKSKN